MRDSLILYDLDTIIGTGSDYDDTIYELLSYFAELLRKCKCEESAELLLGFIKEVYDDE